MRFTPTGAAAAIAVVVFAASAQAQSIDPATFSGTMDVGETITIHKTITLSESGANLVDLFFLADNTGSMGGIVNNAKNGASAILSNVPTGADYNFGVGRGMVEHNPCLGVPMPAKARQRDRVLSEDEQSSR